MSSYRVILAIALFAIPAFAQVGPPTGNVLCYTNVTVTPQLRGEGFTEPTSDITITCTGGTAPSAGGTIPLVNISIFYNTTVTSRLLPTAGNAATANVSEAMLIIDEPGSGLPGYGATLPQILCTTPLSGCAAFVGTVAGPTLGTAVSSGSTPAPNVYQGVTIANSVTFFGVPVLAPGATGSRVFRFTNVRVNAQPLSFGAPGASNPVQASVSISGATTLSLQNSAPNVGYVSNGLSASATSTAFGQSVTQTLSPASVLAFTENYGTVFKTRVSAQQFQGNTLYQGQSNSPVQNVPGAIYNSESGFVLPGYNSQVAGLTDFGTRLKATFNNVPAGVRIFVSTGNVTSGTSAAPVPAVVGGGVANNFSLGYVGYAQLVNNETSPDGNAVLQFPAVPPTASAGSVPVTEVAIGSGTGTAVWEVVNTNPNISESFKFGVYVSYTANPGQNSPFPTTATVNLSLAPTAFSATNLDTSPVPRFAGDASPARNLFLIATNPATLSISKSHAGDFTQGQTGATYTIQVSNTGAVATSGAVTVTDTLPLGLTLNFMTGAGWSCSVNTCTRSDALGAGASYPAITADVNVLYYASSPQVNSVSASGGNSFSANATDSTVILPGCPLAVSGNQLFASPSAAGVFYISTTCNWTASSTDSWIHVTNTSGAGNGAATFTIDANPSTASRTGSISIMGRSGYGVVQNGANNGLRFVPITPCRIADTRNTDAPTLASSTPRDFTIATKCGIPAIAEAYSLNLTVVPLGPLGFLSVWPAGQSQPIVSTLNSLDGRVKANAAIVPAGSNGAITAVVTNPSDLLIDINGYFIPALGNNNLAFYPLTPCRIVDTRIGTGDLAGPALAAATTRTFPVLSGPCSIPATAQAYALNVTAVPSGPLGFVSVWPAGQGQPGSSTLNAPTGAVTANAAIVPAGTSGALNVIATNPTDVIIDINGYFAPPGAGGGLRFYTTTPCRILDTRNAAGTYGGPQLAASASRDFPIAGAACGIPANAGGFSLNATVVPPAGLGFLSLWGPGGQPPVSTLNAGDASIVANAALVPASVTGAVSAFASNLTHLILDINGYFAQ